MGSSNQRNKECVVMKLKPQIIELIEQRYSNTEISKMLKCSAAYAVQVRADYNEVASAWIASKCKKPKEGTDSRKAYDFLVANPEATTSEVCKGAGVNNNAVRRTAIRYGLPLNLSRVSV